MHHARDIMCPSYNDASFHKNVDIVFGWMNITFKWGVFVIVDFWVRFGDEGMDAVFRIGTQPLCVFL
jgi:hypothetical protein